MPKMSYATYYQNHLVPYQDHIINKHKQNKFDTDKLIQFASTLAAWANTWDTLYTDSFQ